MGQAKQRKAEIDKLKSQVRIKWADMRPEYVKRIKQAQEVYMSKLLAADKDDIMSVMKSADSERLHFAVTVGLQTVISKIATVEQIKDACWEGFNGLMEASCVAMNIQERLGLPVEKLDINQFIITGDDCVEQAKARGWF